MSEPHVIPSSLAWACSPQGVTDWPALAGDADGLWLAGVTRENGRKAVILYRESESGFTRVGETEPTGITGIGAPALCAQSGGCLAAFAVEADERWRIAVCRADGGGIGAPAYLDAGGSVNLAPVAATAGGRVGIAWVSNAEGRRAVWAAAWHGAGLGAPVRLSSPAHDSQNPTLVSLDDGRFQVAWDSIRGDRAAIYGATFDGAAVGEERRLTDGALLERHPHLAVHDGRVWIAWQAQSYPGRRVNRLEAQRIVVARLGDDGLEAPLGFFDAVSPATDLLVRPRIAFDAAGVLWLSCRRSMGPQAGWLPVVRAYHGDAWTPPMSPTRHPGRWRPLTPVPRPAGGCAVACECDDLPATWNEQGVWPDWHAWVEVSGVQLHPVPAAQSPVVAPLAMPSTDFLLAEKRALCAADLPRQQAEVDGRALTLFWGDLHDHTDLSVCDRAKNPPGPDLFANVRDIEGLDFCALTDHGYNMDPAQWAYNGEQTRAHHDPGRFVTFLGQEWTSEMAPPEPDGNTNRYGHQNLIHLDPYHPRFYDAYDGDISPRDLRAALGDAQTLCIPHQLACWEGKGKHNVPVQWDYVDDPLRHAVAEICQTRGSYEGLDAPFRSPGATPWRGHFLHDVWARGVIIGVIGSPDHGGGCGKVGVWAADASREAIFAAIRARHTIATSGPKMALLVRGDGLMLGDVGPRIPGTPVRLTIEAVCPRPIRALTILRNNEVVHEVEPDAQKAHLIWVDPQPPNADLLWYYVRLTTADDEWAWSSPLWLRPEGTGAPA